MPFLGPQADGRGPRGEARPHGLPPRAFRLGIAQARLSIAQAFRLGIPQACRLGIAQAFRGWAWGALESCPLLPALALHGAARPHDDRASRGRVRERASSSRGFRRPRTHLPLPACRPRHQPRFIIPFPRATPATYLGAAHCGRGVSPPTWIWLFTATSYRLFCGVCS